MNKYFIIILNFTLLSCLQTERKDGTHYNCNIDQNIAVNKVFSDFQFLQLRDIPDKYSVVNITKVIPFDTGYIVWGERLSIVFIFDKQGRFRHVIDARGAGPEEYIEIGDITYHPKDNFLYILDRAFFLLKFDLSGKCLYKKKLPFPASTIAVDANGLPIMISHTGDKRTKCPVWQLLDDQYSCYDFGDLSIPQYRLGSRNKVAYSEEGKILFTYPLSNTIYQIGRNQRIETYLNLDQCGFIPSQSQVKKTKDLLDLHKGKYVQKGEVFKSLDWLVFGVFKIREPNNYFYCDLKDLLLTSSNFDYPFSKILSDQIVGSDKKSVIFHISYYDYEFTQKEFNSLPQVTKKIPNGMDENSELLLFANFH